MSENRQVIISSDNRDYEGTTFGVKFTAGRAVLNEFTGKNRFGYSVDDLIRMFQHDLPGYTVEVIGEQLPSQVAAEMAGEAATPPALRKKKGMAKVAHKKVAEAA